MTAEASFALQSLIYKGKDHGRPALQVLDQLLLPATKTYVDVTNIQEAWNVIHRMQIRGAPLIAIVAVLGMAVDLCNPVSSSELDAIEKMNQVEHSSEAIYAYIQGKLDFIATSRPTAVNLFNALEEVKGALTKAKDDRENGSSSPREKMVQTIVDHAEFMLKRDEADCRAIGDYGAKEILKALPSDENASVMTICNTGSLATATYGTALGVVRSIHLRGRLKSVIPLETRPYNQGSRLTAFECMQDELSGATLICDSMAAYFMAKHKVSACVVGADRVAANGDTANKIGTYSLALVAKAHAVPFYVAAPFTTLDLKLATGDEIPIEERPANELLSSSRAPDGMPVWNPA